MRVILFTGKGGVGKTTTAAATAVRAARAGVKTLVMSTDPAHSLGDTLGVPLGAGGGGVPVDLEPGLSALQISPPHLLGESWRVVQDYLLAVLDTVGVDAVVAEELTRLPGAEEVAALLELRAQVESGPWDLVVVDCAPTAETLRLLALPEALAWHLERLLPAQRGLIRTLRPAAAAAAGVPLPDQAVLEAVTGWHRQMRQVHRILTGDQTSVRLVLTPERVVIAESRRTWTSLSLYGFVVDAVVVNRVFPDAAEGGREPDAWRASWNAAQQDGLVEVRESFAGLPLVVTPYLSTEPIGADALADLAQAQDGGTEVLAPVVHRGLAVERTDEGFLLVLPLPLAHASDLGLQRRDDELVVTVGEHRRVLTLPSALQRCVVEGASVRDGLLRVRFVPDEEVWPRG
ncbi:arsenite efflux ATP-binding protein ArsA [Pedococcus dokdonensis]|uniref:Arsenite efflux ATP-binding protein ArsA n=1 Tax=Pedococcus dokdonensis TaxID=443156 RepID=A0A1H0MVZ1_9MICO|nr:ArsA family ATPase [Pedococcus dokdonensis]SDO84567.1 arsenite efflux ATP-binding protein ArsA [Pedococcus dokdonensis]